jgi:LysM repeat protein
VRGKVRDIRCRRCGKVANSQLSLCPHCGRELKAATSRWITVGIPAALVVAVLLLLFLASTGGDQFVRASESARSASQWIANLSNQLDPQIAVIPAVQPGAVRAMQAETELTGGAASAGSQPLGDTGDTGASLQSSLATTDTSAIGVPVASATESIVAEVSVPVAEVVAAPSEVSQPKEAIATEAAAIAGTRTITPTQSASGLIPTPTVPLPTATSAAPTVVPVAAAAIPTITPTPSPVPTARPSTVEVLEGDTVLGIATRFNVSVEQLLELNDLSEADATLIQPGQSLRLPAQALATNTPLAANVYVVRPGDTVIAIAARLGVNADALLAANRLSPDDAAALLPGDTLIVPGIASLVTPTPAATTPVVPTAIGRALATSAPTNSAPLGMRLPAPLLRGPLDGVTVRCADGGKLSWEPVSEMAATDSYRLHMGYVSELDAAGNARVTWVVDQPVPATTTQVALDRAMCKMAAEELGNQWRWYVEVAQTEGGSAIPVSPPSDVWSFVWK